MCLQTCKLNLMLNTFNLHLKKPPLNIVMLKGAVSLIVNSN